MHGMNARKFNGCNSNQNSGKKIEYYWPEVSKRLDKFTFFWRFESPFSQHFQIKLRVDDKVFNCSEQFYMYMKAVTFGDRNLARKIMSTADPAEQKRLGKMVMNFDEEKWDEVSGDVVRKGNVAKFGQNERLLNLLVATRGTELVEASPMDRKWGIGLSAEKADALRKETWKGGNKLGKILTAIRDCEFKGYEHVAESTLHNKMYGYKIFWTTSSPFSPFYLSPFKVEQVAYVSLFHYLMHQSAAMFGDDRRARSIIGKMNQNTIEKIAYESNARFNLNQWRGRLTETLVVGNFHKFSDNPNLKALLLDTNGKILVYQSKKESLGNGLEEGDNNFLPSSLWQADNILGFVLTHMRDEWIKNPNVSLDTLLKHDISRDNYNLKDVDSMHMTSEEPPEFQKNLKEDKQQQPVKEVVKESEQLGAKDHWDYKESEDKNKETENNKVKEDSSTARKGKVTNVKTENLQKGNSSLPKEMRDMKTANRKVSSAMDVVSDHPGNQKPSISKESQQHEKVDHMDDQEQEDLSDHQGAENDKVGEESCPPKSKKEKIDDVETEILKCLPKTEKENEIDMKTENRKVEDDHSIAQDVVSDQVVNQRHSGNSDCRQVLEEDMDVEDGSPNAEGSCDVGEKNNSEKKKKKKKKNKKKKKKKEADEDVE